MKAELHRKKDLEHNYERSKAMKAVLDEAGIPDTLDENQRIAQNLLVASKKAEKGNTKVISYLEGTNGTVLLESWWIIFDDGSPYMSTIIIEPVK